MTPESTSYTLSRHEVMAIVNVTPDSFYSGSRCMDDASLEQCIRRAIDEGADIIDIGGCSSRPGAVAVDEEEEWRRVERALRCVRALSGDVSISVDTFRASVARRAYDLVGRIMVNDISSSAFDPELLSTVVELGLQTVVMHMRGTSATMQTMSDYSDVVGEVEAYLVRMAGKYEEAGVRRDNIILDPGFGFAKSVEQNYALLSGLPRIAGHGYRVMAGVSRKRMITEPLEISACEAEVPTGMIEWEALRCGASVIRTHDVRKAVQAVRLYELYDRSRRRI